MGLSTPDGAGDIQGTRRGGAKVDTCPCPDHPLLPLEILLGGKGT